MIRSGKKLTKLKKGNRLNIIIDVSYTNKKIFRKNDAKY